MENITDKDKIQKTKSRKYSMPLIKELYAKSGNECAMYNCSNKLYDNEYGAQDNICHIESLNKGPRYNPELTEEELNSIDNLILLCANCHKRIDNLKNESTYTVEFLKKMKKDHENSINPRKCDNSQNELNQLSPELFKCLADDLSFYFCKKIKIKHIENTLELLCDYNEDTRVLLYKLLSKGIKLGKSDHLKVDLNIFYNKFYSNWVEEKFVNLIRILIDDKIIECDIDYCSLERFASQSDGTLCDLYDDINYLIFNEKWILRTKGKILYLLLLKLCEKENGLEKELFINRNFNVLEMLKEQSTEEEF